MWTYFVNWDKVFDNTRQIELALNCLNYLVDKKDFDNEFRYLLRNQPQVAKVIPALVVRDGKMSKEFKLLIDYSNKILKYEDYNFDKKDITDNDIELYLTFVKNTGLKHLISDGKVKNLVDYMIGVEAGLDSHGRKNRGGTVMEDIIEVFVKDLCKKSNYRYMKEANAEKIQNEFGYCVPVDKSSRRYDFVIDNGHVLFVVETNFYGGGGSKLKSTAGEYRSLYDVLKSNLKSSMSAKYSGYNLGKNSTPIVEFVWITDGQGWESTRLPLRESFEHIDYIFNLTMVEKGILDELFAQ